MSSLIPLAIAIPTRGGAALERCLTSLGPALEAVTGWPLPGGRDPSGLRPDHAPRPPLWLIVEERVDCTSAVGAIEQIVVPTGSSFSARANAGLKAAHRAGAELCLLLNDDTRLQPDTLTALLSDMWIAGATAGGPIVHPMGRPNAIQSAGVEVDLARERVRLRSRLPAGLPPDAAPYAVDALPGTALVLRPGFALDIGGFDEGFPFYFEDIDLCLRLRAVGHRVVVCPAAHIEHEGAASIGRGPEQARLAMFGLRRLLARHGTGSGRRALLYGLAQQLRRGPADLPARMGAVLRGWRESDHG